MVALRVVGRPNQVLQMAKPRVRTWVHSWYSGFSEEKEVIITYLAVMGLAFLTILFIAATVVIVAGVIRTIKDVDGDS